MGEKVFESASISGIKFKNRIIRSAPQEGMADENGFPCYHSVQPLIIRFAQKDYNTLFFQISS